MFGKKAREITQTADKRETDIETLKTPVQPHNKLEHKALF